MVDPELELNWGEGVFCVHTQKSFSKGTVIKKMSFTKNKEGPSTRSDAVS